MFVGGGRRAAWTAVSSRSRAGSSSKASIDDGAGNACESGGCVWHVAFLSSCHQGATEGTAWPAVVRGRRANFGCGPRGRRVWSRGWLLYSVLGT